MALLKDLIVQGASRFIGDAYFATIKEGVWNGTPIDLSHGGTAGATAANQVLLSTSTSGTSTWGDQSSLSVGSASRLSGTSSYTAWGKTYWSNGVPSTISGDMTSVGDITPSENISKSCGSLSNAWLNIYGKYVTSNATLFLTSASATSIIFLPQGSEKARFNTSGNLIIGLESGLNEITTLKLYVDGATTITGTLTLSKTQDLSGTADNSPALIIGGPVSGVHMEIDANEIHAKATDTTTAPLYLNNDGGLVYARGKALAEQNAKTTTAGLVFVSTTTEGRGEWKAASTVTSGNATYAANVGAAGTLHTNYVTAAEVIAVYNWYATMIDENNDSDTLINRWREVCDFLNNFTEADTLASILSTYVTLGTTQTITGAKTFANPISGDLLGNATTADRLKSTTDVGSESLPVYFTGGLPVACTDSSIFSALSSNTTNAVSITVCGKTRDITPSTLRTSLGLGTVYSHAHTDYVTNVSFDDTNRKLQLSKGGGTATDIVTFGTGAFATIADYLPLSGGTMTGSITFPLDQAASYNSDGIKWSDYTIIGSNTGDSLGIYAGGNSIYLRPGVSTDYTKGIVISRTNLTYNGNEVLTAGNYTSYVNSTNFPVLGYTLSGVNGRTVSSSTAGYCAYYSAASTVSGTSLLQFDTTNSITTIKSTGGSPLEVWARSESSTLYWSSIKFSSGSTNKTILGYIGIGGPSSTSVAPNRPFWSITGGSNDSYQLVHSHVTKTNNVIDTKGSTTQPVYVDSNGEIQICTAYSSASVNYATSSGQVRTQSGSTDADHYLTFVDSNNSSATAETIYTDAGITYNPSTNLLTVEKFTASGVVNLSGSTTIDSLTAGDLLVTGNTSLAGNVSLGTITAGTWNGSVIDVTHGGTGCSTLTSGSALIGNGTGAVTFKEIDTTPTNNSSNLITSGGVYTYITSTLGIATTISPNEVTPSLNSARWTSTGINLYTADQGSYMLQISDTTTAAIFTGVFSIYHGASATANALDEIPLHMCANTASVNRIYAATLNGVLYVSSQDTEETQHHLTIKYKKLI